MESRVVIQHAARISPVVEELRTLANAHETLGALPYARKLRAMANELASVQQCLLLTKEKDYDLTTTAKEEA